MKRRAWKVVLGILGGIALILGGFWLWLSSVADRRWEELRADVAKRKATMAQRIGRREPLRGDPLPGNAWTDYRAAVAAITAFPDGEATLQRLAEPKTPVVRSQVASVIDGLQPALDLLRSGGRRVDGKLPEGPRPDVQLLKTLALWKARFDILDGRVEEGVEVLLDSARLMQDLQQESTPAGVERWTLDAGPAYEELRNAVMKGGLSPPAMEALERELDLLDRTAPSTEAAMERWGISLGDRALENPREFIRGNKWILVFHPRLEAAVSYFAYMERFRVLAGIDRMNWAEEQAAWTEFDRRGPSTWKEIDWTADVRRKLAQLRLLRTLLHRRRTGQWLELDDPFGAKLFHAETETHDKAWSVGRDGVDDGGKGDWVNAWKPRAGEDLILEVPRQ